MKPQYTELDIIDALNAVANGQSMRKACLDWGIPPGTLRNRINGHEPRWILTQEALGLSPTHTQIKDFAQRLLVIRGDTITLGKRWIYGFLKRNPILKTKKQLRIDSARVNGATSDIIKAWFQKLEVPEIKAIKS
ncbi:hypothetical protein LARI1_G009560 [Lachnellula arida]|uniref:HTH CENPB-type domain-containing protein n=1 Tax=Lachnellula arida TaxID=1316785 RepID=A0A8T9AYN2_9HELO|nr:hypothetical protein LARI1_G009560 [Lachnellula arida]